MKNYLSNVRARMTNPLRIRIGGNSMDDSVFNSTQAEMIVYTGAALSPHDQPVSYGPVFYDVLGDLAPKIGGAEYLIGKFKSVSPPAAINIWFAGLSLFLREENDTPLIVSTAQQKLTSYLDAFLLGNVSVCIL